MKKVSILVPCYNEEQSLPLLHKELLKLMDNENSYVWEVLFINDGSKDKTIDIIKSFRNEDDRICYVNLSRNFGKEKAMLAGFDFVSGDCMVIMDADLQHPPQIISEMLKYWEQDYDDVYAKRDYRGKESLFRKQISLLFYKVLQNTSRIDMPQNVGDFRLLDRSCIEVLKKLRESERYTKGLFAWIGFNKKEIIFVQEDRIAGKTSWNFRSLLNLAIEGLTSFTTVPLRFSTFFGIIVSLVSFAYMAYVLFKTVLYGESVQGFPTLIIIVLFLGGVQLLSIGIIGEYIGRIFNETKQRPPYVAKEYNGKKI
ncbi:MAG: glycosyltransferase involved in cell wall biosynthesis [Polaribacter sp.]|jgi:glycosyltransferase involved in cell wall biosynthesis